LLKGLFGMSGFMNGRSIRNLAVLCFAKYSRPPSIVRIHPSSIADPKTTMMLQSRFAIPCCLLFVFLSVFQISAVAEEVYDVVIYGGTSGGVAAAVQVRRMGRTVLLIEPTKHLGGLTSGGLGATDIGNKKAIGGISREFYQRVMRHYHETSAWKHERQEDY